MCNFIFDMLSKTGSQGIPNTKIDDQRYSHAGSECRVRWIGQQYNVYYWHKVKHIFEILVIYSPLSLTQSRGDQANHFELSVL